jgi:ligand-binding sensor domain-containing protein
MLFITAIYRTARTYLLALVLIFSINPKVNSQKYFFDNYGIKDGLGDPKVYTLFQDSKNYIWLGTVNGLSRFDGKNFENFTAGDNLASDRIKCVCEDSLGFVSS